MKPAGRQSLDKNPAFTYTVYVSGFEVVCAGAITGKSPYHMPMLPSGHCRMGVVVGLFLKPARTGGEETTRLITVAVLSSR